MDKTWITKPRGTREYNNGCREFVEFAVRNCRTTDGKIRCPCKMCQNNHLHSLDYVLEHLIAGRGMMTSYINWWHHGQMTPYNPDAAIRLNHPATDVAAGRTEESGDMHAMLRDAFGMHEVREENRGPGGVEQLGEENVNIPPTIGGTQKYYDMLKKAEKPLHEGTKHSKLSAIVHMYNLKCVGGVSNNIFLAFLDLINQEPWTENFQSLDFPKSKTGYPQIDIL